MMSIVQHYYCYYIYPVQLYNAKGLYGSSFGILKLYKPF